MTTANTIVAKYGTRLTMHPSDGSTVTADALPKDQARALVSELEAAGHEASDAPDNDDDSVSWVYVESSEA